MPNVCTRHGEPAVERRKLKLKTPTPGWAYALLFVGVLPFFLVAGAVGRTMRAPAWPYCARCKPLERTLAWGAAGLFVLTVVLVFAARFIPERGLASLVVLAAFAALITGIVQARRAATVAGAELSPDGVWVEVKGAHQAFAWQVAAARQAAHAQWTAPAPPAQGPPAEPSAGWIRR
jgi:hypothetical protein